MSWRWWSVLVATTGCALRGPEVDAKLQAALEAAVAEGPPGGHAVLRVDAPAQGLDAVYVVGTASAGRPMTAHTPFLSASVGKLVVAATVVDLAESGLLSLSDPVSRWVAPEVLAPLPAAAGSGAFDTISVGMLLQRRSGLPDYFDTTVHPSRDGALGLLDLLVEDPSRGWDRTSVLAYTAAHFDAAGEPGASFLYSDLNYDLLGLVIEGVTGAPWHVAVRERVLDPLQMASTRAHGFEARPAGVPEVAEARVGAVVITGTPALGLDGAGGGLVTTTGDLVRLMRGLERGEPVSLEALAPHWTEDAMHRGIDYGYGLWRIRPGGMLFVMAGLPTLQGVSGSTGSFVYRLEDGAVVSGTFDQHEFAEEHVRFLVAQVLPVLARAEAQ